MTPGEHIELDIVLLFILGSLLWIHRRVTGLEDKR